MQRSRFTEEQIIGILRGQEWGVPMMDLLPQARAEFADVLQVEGAMIAYPAPRRS
jgi:hypothetical protein